jgi:aquaporin Z
MQQKLVSEFLGTFWLVLGGCGSAVLAAAFPALGIGFVGVSLAFGLTVVTGAYALGPISGGHFNPAVSIGLWAGKRFPGRHLLPYIAAQVVGAVVAAGVLYIIASGKAGFDASAGFASNGYGVHSPGGYTLTAALVTEVVMTFMFLIVIRVMTHQSADKPHVRSAFAPIDHPSRQHSCHQHVQNLQRSTAPRFSRGWAFATIVFCSLPRIVGGCGRWLHHAPLSRPEPDITGRR